MGCNLREVYSRHTAATSASAESQSQFPSGVGGAEGGPSNKLVRALEAASWPWRDVVEEAGCDRRPGDTAVRPTGRPVGHPQTPPRPSSSAQALVVTVGTYVPAEFGSCADAKLAVDAR
jgi:hypothetical protein